jgi:hypothetical protein
VRAGSRDDVVRPCAVRLVPERRGDVAQDPGDMATGNAEQPVSECLGGIRRERVPVAAAPAGFGYLPPKAARVCRTAAV